ncbi:MAG: YbaB/EbfC family nucleoid-associated protein [Candidatus Gribaldobacteria bacterium]|nr:YbaB/EbfC family nucleoid-associated protein [Candidatus Gribaldobacteria bacterium]
MFDKFKQMKQLIDLQNQMKQERAEVEKNGVKVVVNGKMEVLEIQLNEQISVKDQERIVKDCINDAFKQVQTKMAGKMSNLPGLGL